MGSWANTDPYLALSPWPLKPSSPRPAPLLDAPAPSIGPLIWAVQLSPPRTRTPVPTQVCAPSAGASCDTEEFTTLKSLGKYTRSLHTRGEGRFFRQDQLTRLCCQLSVFSVFLPFHGYVNFLCFPVSAIFCSGPQRDRWSLTECRHPGILCCFCFTFSIAFSASNTHKHRPATALAWFILQWARSLTPPRLRSPGLLYIVCRKLISHSYTTQKTLHFGSWYVWALLYGIVAKH